MKISVAMCTFNGASHLEAQLHSIASQTRRPDELVICDDSSSDATNDVALRCASATGLKLVHRVNPHRLGVTANFEQAIARCTGDVIFLSDQDDVWAPQKIERMLDALTADEADMVFCDMTLMNDRDEPLPGTQWQRLGFGRKLQKRVEAGRTFELLLRFNVINGNAMAFRASLREKIVPLPTCYVHDEWIALVAAALGRVAIVREPMVRYRMHRSQEVGPAVTGLRAQLAYARQHMGADYFDRMVERSKALAERLQRHAPELRDPCYLDWARQRIAHMQVRRQIRDRRWSRLPIVAREAAQGFYHRFGYGWKSLAQDLFL